MKELIAKIKEARKFNIEAIIIIFLLLQPIMDIYMAVVGEKLDIFGFSAVTIIRNITISVLFLITIYNIFNKNNKKISKTIWVAIGYIAIVVIYSLIHHFNIVAFNRYYIDNNLYNMISEGLYVVRLASPIIFIYIIYNNKVDIKSTTSLITFIATTISAIIVITNVFKISFVAYANDNSIIVDNIFGWFNGAYEKYNYKLLTSKGFFASANQIGAVLAVLLPITILNSLRKKTWIQYLMVFIQIIAMIMIGSRIASIGWALITIATILAYIIFCIIRKEEKVEKRALITLLTITTICLLITINSPVTGKEVTKQDEENYQKAKNKIKESNIEEKVKSAMTSDEKLYILANDIISEKQSLVGDYNMVEQVKSTMNSEEELYLLANKILYDKRTVSENYNIKELKIAVEKKDVESIRNTILNMYIEGYYKYNYISSTYIKKIYPHEDDPEFWFKMFDEPFYIKADNRGLQKAIIKRLKENNDNEILDTLFGMGATSLNNREYMIENDIIGHYYNLGIGGILLFLSPYIIIIIISGIIMIVNFKEKFTIDNAIYIFSILIAIAAGVLGGHVFDEYIATFFIAYIAAILLKNCCTKEAR